MSSIQENMALKTHNSIISIYFQRSLNFFYFIYILHRGIHSFHQLERSSEDQHCPVTSPMNTTIIMSVTIPKKLSESDNEELYKYANKNLGFFWD